MPRAVRSAATAMAAARSRARSTPPRLRPARRRLAPARCLCRSPLQLTSMPPGQTQHERAAVGAVADASAALAGADELPRRPGQVGVAVQVTAGDRVAEVLAFGIDLEAVPEPIVQARRDPVESIRDRRPAGHFGALIALDSKARLVIPVHIRRPVPLVVQEPDGEGGRRRGVDGADEVAELVVALCPGRGEL